MLELIANHGDRCEFLVLGVKDRMTGGDQSSWIGHRIEWHREDEALRLDKVLLDGALVPNLVDGSFVVFAEVVTVLGYEGK